MLTRIKPTNLNYVFTFLINIRIKISLKIRFYFLFSFFFSLFINDAKFRFNILLSNANDKIFLSSF